MQQKCLHEKVQNILNSYCQEFSFESAKLITIECQNDIILAEVLFKRHILVKELVDNRLEKALSIVRYRLNVSGAAWIRKVDGIARIFESSIDTLVMEFVGMDRNVEYQKIHFILKFNDSIANKHGRGTEEDRLMREFTRVALSVAGKGPYKCNVRIFEENRIICEFLGLTNSCQIESLAKKAVDRRMKVEEVFQKAFAELYPNRYIGVRCLLNEDKIFILIV